MVLKFDIIIFVHFLINLDFINETKSMFWRRRSRINYIVCEFVFNIVLNKTIHSRINKLTINFYL